MAVTLTLTNNGRIQGKGGAGVQGGGAHNPPGHAANGNPGGDAFEALQAITIDNTDGQIWGGGGSGGSGGAYHDFTFDTWLGGPGSGAGAGTTSSPGGAVGDSANVNPNFPDRAGPGQSSTSTSGGAAGTQLLISGGVYYTGAAGPGGGPGEAGGAGTGGHAPNGETNGSSGVARGNYIVGNSFVTWAATGDVRGGSSG